MRSQKNIESKTLEIKPTGVTQSAFMKAYKSRRPLLLDLDPRIDFTKPVYEQVLKLQAKDKAAKKRGQSTAA